ncbi:MAG: hypothetical protein P4L30_10100, partial [Candidatus Limnocylindrales bacterium]|nr:hypothetical protein [Candidatus Limnocylindrales bacterium]
MSNRFSKAARGALALAVLSILAVACSGASSTSPNGGGDVGTSAPLGAAAGAPGSAPAADGSPVVVTGHVGDKLTVIMLGGAKADLTLVKVADPA